jgi:fumarate reductase subunit D
MTTLRLTPSNAPVVWLLFGAGGMLAALLGPMLVFITGIAVPLGWTLPPDLISYPRALAFAQHWAGKAFLAAVIVLFAWHAAHRIFHSLHDLGVPTGAVAKLGCYGGAAVASAIALIALLAIGF